MSLNNSLNAAIAIIENKPDIARRIFRNPDSDVDDISGALARVYKAIDKRVVETLRVVLVQILAVQPKNEDNIYCEGFYDGVVGVENMIESIIENLEE